MHRVVRVQAGRSLPNGVCNRHFRTGAGGVYAYDATNVVLDALDKRQQGWSLKETILAMRHFEGLQSRFSFDDFGDVQRPHASISIVQDGKFVVLE